MAQPVPPTDSSQHTETHRTPPVVVGRNFRHLVRDPLAYFQAVTAAYGDILCYRPAPDTAYLINHPDYVRHVLVENNRNYSKETHTNQTFNKVVAEGTPDHRGRNLAAAAAHDAAGLSPHAPSS